MKLDKKMEDNSHDFSKFEENIENLFKNMGFNNLRITNKPIFGWDGVKFNDEDGKTLTVQTINRNLIDVLKENQDKVVVIFIPPHMKLDFSTGFRGAIVEKKKRFGDTDVEMDWNPIVEFKVVDGDISEKSTIKLNDIIALQELHNTSPFDTMLESLIIQIKENYVHE